MDDVQRMKNVIAKFDRVELKHALKAFRVDYMPGESNKRLRETLQTYVIFQISRTTMSGPLKKAQALSGGISKIAKMGVIFLLVNAMYNTGLVFAESLGMGLVSEYLPFISSAAQSFASGVAMFRTVASYITTPISKMWTPTENINPSEAADNIRKMFNQGTSFNATQTPNAAPNVTQTADFFKYISNLIQKLDKERLSGMFRALTEFKTILMMIIAVYGMTYVIEAFGAIFSINADDAKKIIDKLISKDVRYPNAKKYAELKTLCEDKMWISCNLKNECEWNKKKKKCSVNSKLKYIYKVAKTSKELRMGTSSSTKPTNSAAATPMVKNNKPRNK